MQSLNAIGFQPPMAFFRKSNKIKLFFKLDLTTANYYPIIELNLFMWARIQLLYILVLKGVLYVIFNQGFFIQSF